MPIKEIPINTGPNKDVEEIGLVTHGAAAQDVYFDSNGNVARRPGLVELCDFGPAEGITGLYWWDRQSKVIAVCGGNIYEITDSTGTNSLISGDTLQVGNHTYWGDFGTSLYAANGGRIVKIPSSGSAAYVSDASAPTTVSHIAVIDDTLLALETGTENIHYSDTSDPDTWSGNWIAAVARPDLVKAIGVANDKIELLGTEVLEGWRNDGVTPFVKDAQYTVNRGTAAQHSFIFIEDMWYFLDQERKAVRINGRTPEVLSLTMNKYIQDFESVSDAISGKTSFNGRPQYVLSFPTEDKTLVYDIYNGLWSEIGKWNSGTSSYNRFIGETFCTATGWNLSLIGNRSTGKVYKFDSGTYEDDGNTLRSMIRTSHIHHGYPGLWKRSSRLDFYLKKADVDPATDTAELIVKWRDNGATTWGSERTLALGRTGRTDFHGYLTRMGHYKTRQYELAITDNSPLVLSKVFETFKVKGLTE